MTKVYQICICRHGLRNEGVPFGNCCHFLSPVVAEGFGAGGITEGILVGAAAQSCLQLVPLSLSWQGNELLLMCFTSSSCQNLRKCLCKGAALTWGHSGSHREGCLPQATLNLGFSFLLTPSLEPLKVNPGTLRSH